MANLSDQFPTPSDTNDYIPDELQIQVKEFLAVVFGIESEDIDSFIIATVGKCNHCEQRNGYSLVDNIRDDRDFIGTIGSIVRTRIEGHK